MKYALGNMLNGAGSINPDGLAIDLQFAADKSYAADGTVVNGTGQFNIASRKGPPAKFTRGSGATFVDSDGLIQYAPENLLLWSEGLNNPIWSKSSAVTSSPVVTGDQATSPSGTLSADRIAFPAVSGTGAFSLVSQSVVQLAGVVYTASIYLRGLNGGEKVWFAWTPNGTTYVRKECILTTSWQRFDLSYTSTAGNNFIQLGVDLRDSSQSAQSAQTIFAWGAQLERHTSARAYIPTTTAVAYAPRFDHDPVTLASRGLLIEEQRQNLLSFSESINNIAWNAFATATATDNQTTSPSGVASSASRLTANAGTDTIRTRVRITNITTGGSTYSASAFVKAGASNFGVVYMSFNKSGTGVIRNCDAHIVFSTGVVTQTGVSNANFTVTSTPYPDGWYRITISATSNASTAVEDQVVLGVGISFNGTGGSGTFTGTETVFAWGAQLEAGSFATSYIPTTTSALTRSADVCNITGAAFNGFYNQPEGTILVNAFTPANGDRTVVATDDNTANEMIRLRTEGTNPFFKVTDGGSELVAIDSGTVVANTAFKLAGAYKLNDFASSINGGAAVTDTTGTIPTVDRMRIGSGQGGNTMCGCVSSLRYYKKRLPDAKLVTLTI